jgi:hypothetical protein
MHGSTPSCCRLFGGTDSRHAGEKKEKKTWLKIDLEKYLPEMYHKTISPNLFSAVFNFQQILPTTRFFRSI